MSCLQTNDLDALCGPDDRPKGLGGVLGGGPGPEELPDLDPSAAASGGADEVPPPPAEEDAAREEEITDPADGSARTRAIRSDLGGEHKGTVDAVTRTGELWM